MPQSLHIPESGGFSRPSSAVQPPVFTQSLIRSVLDYWGLGWIRIVASNNDWLYGSSVRWHL